MKTIWKYELEVNEKNEYYATVFQRHIDNAITTQKREKETLTRLLSEAYKAIIQTPLVHRGDAIRWQHLCDRILDVIGEDPIKTATDAYHLECDCGWDGTSNGLEEKNEWWECPSCKGEAQPPNEI